MKKYFIMIAVIIGAIIGPAFVSAQTMSERLAGRILIQVESVGEAWYLNPQTLRRHYLGRPADAFRVMRELGLGISETDWNRLGNTAPSRLSGRILLRVESAGEAYYINPVDLHIYYLGRPADAFRVMRELGLGISNSDLSVITPDSIPEALKIEPVVEASGNNTYEWTFGLQKYYLSLELSKTMYSRYSSAQKVYTYYGKQPANWEEQYYQMFIDGLNGDDAISRLNNALKSQRQDMSDNEFLEFSIAMIQYIEYEKARGERILAGAEEFPRYPYETLYLHTGVCSDKTFLAYRIAKEHGYGVAILTFPDRKHSALGIACPVEESLNNSGYCYVETTSYFPFGVIPRSFSGGQAQSGSSKEYLASLFDPSILGMIEISNKQTGKKYQGVSGVKAKVTDMIRVDTEIEIERGELNTEADNVNRLFAEVTSKYEELQTLKNSGDIVGYNAMVPVYNAMVVDHREAQTAYNEHVATFNAKIEDYNHQQELFFQR